MGDDGFEIFTKQTEVIESDHNRRIALTFGLALVTAIGVGVLAVWVFVSGFVWFAEHVLKHLPRFVGLDA